MHVADNGQMSLAPEMVARQKARRGEKSVIARKPMGRASAKGKARASPQHAQRKAGKAIHVANK